MKQKIYKLCSVLLTLALVLSTCICAIGTVSAANVATYYVSPDGVDTNDGLTATAPVASVEKAVTLANAAGYGAGDTVYVKVIHVADKSTTWAAAAQIAAHAFTLDLSSNGDIAQVGAVDSAMTFNGPTKLSNIKMMWGKKDGTGYPTINFAGNDVVIGNGVSAYNAMYNFYFAKSGTFDKDLYLTFKGPFNKTMFMGGDWSGPTLNKNVYIDFAGTGSYDFRVGTNGGDNEAGAHATKVNAAVNINLKSGTPKLTFVSDAYKMRYGENSAVQVINSVGVATNDWVTALTTTKENTSKPSKYYIINNKSGLPKAVQFTDTVGKFKVNLSKAWNVVVKDAAGAVVENAINEGVLDLSALASGVYNIEATKTATEELTLYVSPNGNDEADGKTVDTPVATIGGAIAAAQDNGMSTGDTVYLKLIKAGDVKQELGVLGSHGFKLKISSNADKATINMGRGIDLAGDVDFENVTLAWVAQQWPNFTLGSHNVSIGAGVDYSAAVFNNLVLASTSGAQNENINLYFESLPNTFRLGGMYVSPTFKNINITLNGAGINKNITFGAQENGNTTTYDGILNINIKKAATFGLANARKDEDGYGELVFTKNFAAQIINSTGDAALTNGAETYLKAKKTNEATPAPVKYYILDNNTGSANAVEATDTVGKFKVNIDTQRFQLLANGTPVEVSEGFATFAPGKYTLTLKVINPYNETYFVKTGATDGNGTEAAPFATVAEAIAAANAKGCVYGDNVAIKLAGEEAVVWGESEKFSFIPVVESANKEALTPVIIDKDLQGEIVLDYVVVDNTAPTGEGFKRMTVNGNNIKLGANVQGDIEFVGAKQAGKYISGQTVEINTSAVKNIYVGNTNQNNLTFAGDVNYILNNEELSTRFNFMPFYGHKIGIDGNFNIKVVAAKSITIGKASVEAEGDRQAGRVNITGEGKGANLIVPVATNVVGLDQFALISDSYFVIKTGREVDINFTEYAGEYEFDYDEAIYNLVVTDAEGNALVADTDYSYDDGILFFFAPGEYTVALECIECIYDRECDTTCNRCGEVDETRVHKFSTYAPKDAAECGKNATEIATCDYGCGTEDVRDVEGSALEHDFQWIIDKKNNCGVKGAKHEECSLCHEKRNENTAIAATGKHTYSNNCDTSCNVCKATRTITHAYKTTTTKATTSKNGKIVKACSVCGKVYSTKTIYYAKKVKLSTTEYTYSSSKTRKPSVKVYDYKGNKISSSNYEVSYKDNKKVGKATVTIKFKGNYSGTLKATFKILPKESKVDKLTAAKKSLKVKIKKVSSQATGYEIQYSTSSKFSSKYTKTKKVTSYKTTSVTLKSLKAKKTYYVRVRTYKTVDGKKYYSDWSSKKSKKTK